ncbi:MAG TPA: M67 family metallopeptidase, partial [Candidatus Acidoferrales bacterium]|jgi:proteasome lid subunit RPN8/RPN11
MADPVRISSNILEAMLEHAHRESHIECCGLLAGRDGMITAIYPAANALGSATVYEIAPKELFQMFREMREEGLTHLGQYHSHLLTENFPSSSDIEQAGYPEQAYFIMSLRVDAPKNVRAFSIRDGVVSELEIIRVEE